MSETPAAGKTGFKLPEIDALLENDGVSRYRTGLSAWRDLTFIGTLASRASPDIRRSAIGIGYETLDRDTFDPVPTYPLASAAGVKWARVQTGWHKTETAKGRYEFRWLDDIVDGLLAAGIQPWFSVSFGNGLYTATDNHLPGYVGEVPLYHGDEAVEGWRRYVFALATHFGPRVPYWEIWNEPNTGFWRPAPNAADYAALVRISKVEIRKALPEAKIIGGALSGCDVDFLRDALEAGLGRDIDVLSLHPYGSTASGMAPELTLEKDLSVVRALLRRYDCRATLWQGECGRPSAAAPLSRFKKGFRLSQYTQAKFLLRRILYDLAMEFEVTSYFAVSDFHNYGRKGNTHHQGILETVPDGCRPKLAYFALQGLTALFDGDTRRTDYVCNCCPPDCLQSLLPQAATRCLTFERRGVPLLAYWVAENPDVEFAPMCVWLKIWQDPQFRRLETPVLIDPLHRKVYGLSSKTTCGKRQLDLLVPLYDHPLIVTDQALLTEERLLNI